MSSKNVKTLLTDCYDGLCLNRSDRSSELQPWLGVFVRGLRLVIDHPRNPRSDERQSGLVIGANLRGFGYQRVRRPVECRARADLSILQKTAPRLAENRDRVIGRLGRGLGFGLVTFPKPGVSSGIFFSRPCSGLQHILFGLPPAPSIASSRTGKFKDISIALAGKGSECDGGAGSWRPNLECPVQFAIGPWTARRHQVQSAFRFRNANRRVEFDQVPLFSDGKLPAYLRLAISSVASVLWITRQLPRSVISSRFPEHPPWKPEWRSRER
jgi:hypothetical protein